MTEFKDDKLGNEQLKTFIKELLTNIKQKKSLSQLLGYTRRARRIIIAHITKMTRKPTSEHGDLEEDEKLRIRKILVKSTTLEGMKRINIMVMENTKSTTVKNNQKSRKERS